MPEWLKSGIYNFFVHQTDYYFFS